MTIDQLPTLADPTGDVYFPVNKNGADYKLATGGVTHLRGTNSSTDVLGFIVANNARFLLVTSAAASTGKGAYIFNTTSAGTITNSAVLAASGVTISTAANYLTLDFANTGSWMILVFNGTVTLDA